MSPSFVLRCISGRSEAGVAGRTVWRVGAAGGDAVAVTVGRVAEVGATAGDTGIAAGRAGRVVARAVATGSRAEPVGAPLPDVADHVAEVVAVGAEGGDGCGAWEPVLLSVVCRELALPDVATVRAARYELVTPRVALLHAAAAGGELPFGLGRQAGAGPFTKGHRIVPGDVDDRVLAALVCRRARPFRGVPAGAADGQPPRCRACRPCYLHRAVARDELVEDERPAEALGLGDIPGGADEGGEALVADGMAVEMVGADRDLAHGSFAVGREATGVVGAHQERAAVQADHAFMRTARTRILSPTHGREEPLRRRCCFPACWPAAGG